MRYLACPFDPAYPANYPHPIASVRKEGRQERVRYFESPVKSTKERKYDSSILYL